MILILDYQFEIYIEIYIEYIENENNILRAMLFTLINNEKNRLTT